MNPSNIKTNALFTMNYGNQVEEALLEVQELWKRFCHTQWHQKQSIGYSNTSTGVGYEYKEGTGYKEDKKENFDMSENGLQWLRAKLSSLKVPIIDELIEANVKLLHTIKPLIFKFAEEMEQRFEIQSFLEEVQQSQNDFFLRLAHYYGEQPIGTELAHAHTDNTCFAVHMYEDIPAFQIFTEDGQWIDVPIRENEFQIIPGLQLQFRTQGKIKAVSHRAIATSETNEKFGRYIGTCFVPLQNTPRYHKKTFGRQQEKQPGWNYNLLHEEFSKLFVS